MRISQILPITLLGGIIVEVGESVRGLNSSSRLQRRIIELAGRIGKRALRILVNYGSTSNYVSAQECTSRNIRIEKEKVNEELKMADGSVIRIEGGA